MGRTRAMGWFEIQCTRYWQGTGVSTPYYQLCTRNLRYEHPVVLIAGALTGIGRAAALAFARERYRVVVSGRQEDVGQGLAAELRGLGGEVGFFRADARHDNEVSSVVAPAR